MNNDWNWFKRMILEELEKQHKTLEERFSNDSEPSYEKMEYDCKTTITDEDMLQIQINHALDTGNKELFIKLTNELNKEKLTV